MPDLKIPNTLYGQWRAWEGFRAEEKYPLLGAELFSLGA